MRTALRCLTISAAVLACTPAASFAQDPPALDVSFGYSFVRDTTVDENFNGWLGSATWYFNPSFGMTGEIGGNYQTIDAGAADINLSLYSFMTGLRATAATNENVTVFAQLLIGGVRGSVSVLDVTDSSTEFAIQPGGGADIWLTPDFGVRLGGDYRRVFTDVATNQARFHAGLVWTFGRR